MTTQTLSFLISTDCDEATQLTWTAVTSDPCLILDQYTSVINPAIPNQTYQVNFVVSSDDPDCFTNGSVTITVVDDLGNSTSTTQTLVNPCTGLSGTLNQQVIGDYPHSFVANIGGGSGSYQYFWSYDEQYFDEVSSNGNVLSLRIARELPGPLPPQSTVYLTVIDSNGCELELSIVDYLCAPAAQDLSFTLSCYPSEQTITDCGEVVAGNSKLRITAEPCSGRNIDWSTLEWESSDGLCLVVSGVSAVDDTELEVNIYALSGATAGDAQLKWQVKDTEGIVSNRGTLYTTIPSCSEVELTTPPVVIEDVIYELSSAELTPGTEIEIDIDDFISGRIHVRDSSVQRLNWGSFTFIASTGQTLLTSTTLTALNGSVELTLDHKVKFTVGASINCNVELIRFRIQDGLGNYSNEGRIRLDFEPATAPVTVADSDCVVCGETVEIDILSNDTGIINPGSVDITDEPTLGKYSIASADGKLTYAANPNNEGTDTLDYRVANPDGRYSNDSTVTVTVICSGRDATVNNLCLVSGINLESYLSDYATSGGTWSAFVGNPSSPSLASPTNVDFSAALPGGYVFYYDVSSGSCSDRATITLNFIESSVNDDCSAALPISYPAAAGETRVSDDQEILTCDSISTVSALSPLGPLQYPPSWNRDNGNDLWYTFTTGTGLLTPKIFVDSSNYGDGLVNPRIAVYDNNCGVDTFTLIDSAANGNNSRYVELELSALSPSTTYYIRVAGGTTGDNDGLGEFTLGIFHS